VAEQVASQLDWALGVQVRLVEVDYPRLFSLRCSGTWLPMTRRTCGSPGEGACLSWRWTVVWRPLRPRWACL